MPGKQKIIPYPEMLRGSLINLTRKCGKPNCACAQGEPHSTPALSYSQTGKTKIITLRQEDIAPVKAALVRQLRQTAALDKQALAGLAQLRRKLEREKKQNKPERR